MTQLVRGEVVWRLHATHGFPLDLSIPLLHDRGCVPTWFDLVRAARADGANVRALLRRLHDIAGDTYDPETATTIRAGLARYPEAHP